MELTSANLPYVKALAQLFDKHDDGAIWLPNGWQIRELAFGDDADNYAYAVRPAYANEPIEPYPSGDYSSYEAVALRVIQLALDENSAGIQELGRGSRGGSPE